MGSRMQRSLRLTTSLLAVALPGAAMAAGPVAAPAPEPAPIVVAPAPLYNWTGFSAGAQLGYGEIETEGPDLEGDDALYGLRAYYDYDFGTFVVGGGIQYDFADIDLEEGAVSANVEGVLRVGARAGFDSNRNWYYGTAGFAQAYGDDDADTEIGDSSGYFVGLGYEVFITENITAGAEVLYHEFDDFDVDDLEAEATTVSLSVNYRF